MPQVSPKRGWASQQSRVLADVRHFALGSLRHVKEVAVTNPAGVRSVEQRLEPLAYHMAEEVTNVDEGQNRLDVAAEQEAKLMAARKAFAKVQLRTRLDNRVHKVDEGLYIAGAGGAKNWEAIQEAGITHIINASPMVPCFFKDMPNIRYLAVDVYDSSDADISQHFSSTSDFISESLAANGSVLVHCYAGQSRSTTLLAAHLMIARGLQLRDALAMLQAARPSVCPNLGFMCQLKSLEQQLGAVAKCSRGIHKNESH